MKKIKINPIVLAIISLAFLNSCENNKEEGEVYLTGTYIVNYGNFSGSKTTISAYDAENDTVYNNIYKSVNEVEILSNVQYVGIHKGIAYLMSNDGDKIDIVDANSFKATVNPISENIVKPRYIVFDDKTAYVSCWGDVTTDWADMGTSYIAKIDLESRTVTKKIDLPGGPEGMAIVNGKLYAALNYLDSIAVMDLSSESINYIQTPAVSSYFIEDDEKNLFVSFTSTWNDRSLETGIGYINTATDEIDTIYQFEGVSSNYGSIMQFNKDESKIFIVRSYVELVGDLFIQKGGVSYLDLTTGEYSPFLENLIGINAISIDPVSDNVYCLFADGLTLEGTLKIYDNSGSFITSQSTGLSPIMTVFVD